MKQHEDVNDVISHMFAKMQTQARTTISEKLTVREFEWYEIETKIRVYVYKLLEPHLRTFIELKQHQQESDSMYAKHIQDYTSFKKLCLEDGDGIPVIEFLKKEVSEQATALAQQRKSLEYESKQSLNRDDQMAFQIKQLEISLSTLNEFKGQYQQELAFVNANNLKYKDELTRMIESLGSDQVKHEDTVRVMTQGLRERINDLHDQSSSLRVGADSLKSKIEFNSSALHEHYKLILKNQQNIEMLRDDTKSIKDIEGKIIKASHGWQNTLQKLSSLENYLEKYQPLYIQGLISDTMHNVLPSNLKEALAVYEEDKFAEMHKTILHDDGHAKLQEKMDQFSQFIEHIVKRNKHIVRDRKAEELYQKRMMIPTKAVEERTVSPSSSDSESRRPSLKPEVIDNKRFNDSMVKELQSLCKRLAQLEDVIPLHNMDHLNQLEQVKAALESKMAVDREHTAELEGQLVTLPAALDRQATALKSLSEQLAQLLQYCILNSHLAIQDEIDKQGVALCGVKEELSQAQSPIRMDQGCLSCSGQSAILMSAFKLACLSYQPSQVFVDGQAFKREELLEVGQTILKNLKRNELEMPVRTRSDHVNRKRVQTRSNHFTTECDSVEETAPRMRTQTSMRQHRKAQSAQKQEPMFEGSMVFGKDHQSYLLGKAQQQKLARRHTEQTKMRSQNTVNKRMLFVSLKN